MTLEEEIRGALEAAQQRFGSDAVVALEIAATGSGMSNVIIARQVGSFHAADTERNGRLSWTVKGAGPTWAEAFDAADAAATRPGPTPIK